VSAIPFVTRVVLQNYKSIARCSVQLGALSILIGPNGSGKSNFLDALRFVADSLRLSLDHALRDRGGFPEVVRQGRAGVQAAFGVRVDFALADGRIGHYAFRVVVPPGRDAVGVEREECLVLSSDGNDKHEFVVAGGRVHTTAAVAPVVADDRLYLVAASGLPEFRDVYEGLSRMGFYNLNPDRIRDLQTPDAGAILARDGSNLASVLARLSPTSKARVEEYLGQVVPGVRGVDRTIVGPRETLVFDQSHSLFLASNMSDGTLRALGILVALFQSANSTDPRRVPFIGIEEPEIALHPRAAGVLLDSLREASASTQVVVTSHSPDLLDDKDIDSDSLLAVVAEDGETHIGPIDQVGRAAMREHLYTAGDLLRLDQVRPDSGSLDRAALAAVFDLDRARRADSFDKFHREIRRLLGVGPTIAQ
jgi:predicted ATPase